MNLEAVADELYEGSPDDFVERRQLRVAEARASRDRPLATAISRLRRPTRSAWMINLLSREARDEVGQLLELGPALADAQQRADGDELRRLSAARHAALAALVRRAVALAGSAGHVASEGNRQEVAQTLQAALAEPAVAGLVRTGRVSQAVSYGGFGPMLQSVPAAGTVEVSSPTPPEDESDPAVQDPSEELARQRAAAEVAAAREAHAAAEQEAADAADDAEAATQQADELAEAVAALREQLEQLESDERRAREEARAARQRAQQHQQLVRDAADQLAVAREALARMA